MQKVIVAMVVCALFLGVIYIGLNQKDDVGDEWAVSEYHAFAVVNPDGSMTVKEYITYQFLESYKGTFERHLNTSTVSNISSFEVSVATELDKKDVSKSTLKPLHPMNQSGGQEEGVYAFLSEDQEKRSRTIKVFYDNKKDHDTFVFEYRLNDLVSVYRDTAVVLWQFVPPDHPSTINNAVIHLSFPGEADTENLHHFVEGPINYSIKELSGNTVQIECKDVKNGQPVKALLLLPPSLIPDGRKKIDNDSLMSILEYQREKEKEVALLRKQLETRAMAGKLLIYLSLSVLGLTIIYIFFRHDKDPKTEIIRNYTRELPAQHFTPAELGVLINKGRIMPRDIIATLLDLVRKGYIQLNIGEGEKGRGPVLVLQKNTGTDKLKPHEDFIINWIFKDIGNGRTVFIRDIEECARGWKTANRFHARYTIWRILVLRQAKRWKFEEQVGMARILGIVVSIIGFIPGYVAISHFGDILGGASIILVSILLMVYSPTIYKRSRFGAINYTQWISFKNYLKNIKRTDIPLPNLKEMEGYLAFAVTLGVAGRVMKQLLHLYNDKDFQNGKLTFLYKENLKETSRWLKCMNYYDSILRKCKRFTARVAGYGNKAPVKALKDKGLIG